MRQKGQGTCPLTLMTLMTEAQELPLRSLRSCVLAVESFVLTENDSTVSFWAFVDKNVNTSHSKSKYFH